MSAKVSASPATSPASSEVNVDDFLPKSEIKEEDAVDLPQGGDNVGAAQLFESGVSFPPGFEGVVEISAVKRRGTQASGTMIYIEARVVSMTNPGVASSYINKKGVEIKTPPCEIGDSRSYGIKLSNLQMSGPNRKQFTVAALGIDWTTRKAYYEQTHMQKWIDNVVGFSEINDAGMGHNVFKGRRVGLRTHATITQAKGDFTVHTWLPLGKEVDPSQFAVTVDGKQKFNMPGFRKALAAQ